MLSNFWEVGFEWRYWAIGVHWSKYFIVVSIGPLYIERWFIDLGE